MSKMVEKVFLVKNEYLKKYFSGVSGIEGYVLTGKAPAFFTDARYFLRLKEELKNSSVKPLLYKDYNAVKEYLKDNRIEKVYIDFDSTTITEYQDFYSKLGVEILSGTKDIKELRAVKSPMEIENIKKACEIAEKSLYEILPFIKEGVTELEVKELLVKQFIKNGASGESFETIVAFSKNSAIPHHQTGTDKLTKNQPVLIDTGAIYNGYASDITRTFFFGTPSEKFVNAYNAVLKANLIAIERIESGISLKDADNVAREYLKSQNLADNFTHSLGHGLGLEIHEYPALSPKGEGTLHSDMVFTIEPGVYFDGEFGIRIEDTVMLENGKVKRLFKDEKKLLII